ncbi:protein LNK1-like isoform X2 [Phragmites australis]|uniref:protein LNK1-like isoform X2 n=1 Tax=Phragmites australis TaxID=29695 RepID=UPI002D783239|nr:protein LNK1-like isoform X2 [Phragmites australis]
MPDWRVGEFEGKFKDEFAQSNNNEHEGGIGTPGITSSKKLKHAVASEESPQGGISGANNTDSQKCNSEHIQSANGVISQNINSTNNCIGDCKDGSNTFPLREENTTTETRCPTDNWNTCQFALSNGSPILNNHSAPQGSLTYGDNDLNYIEWPGIDNFEEVDTLFRTCDSTYGQQQLENTNELSWIPSSSDAVYSSDVALQQGFDSSYSDYGILDDLSAFHCADDKSLSSVDPSVALCDKQFNDNYLFNEQKNVNAYDEQVYQEDAMEFLPTDQICSGHENFDMVGSQYSSGNAIQGIEEKQYSIASASQLSSSQNLLKKKHHLDSSSPSNITSEPYPERNGQFSPSGASFAQMNTKVQKKVVNIQPRQPISDNVVNGHPQTLTRRASYPCENYETERKGLGKRTLGDPQVTMGTSMVVDGSFVSSMSSDNSVEESSFRQLQDAVRQLDVQTKLCIRDGLYRLARSAQHRQVFPNTMNSNGDSQDVKDMQNAETSRKFVDPRSIETQTNPIDRSIALLLFHQSSDHVTGAVDDASSLKSHKKQHQGPAKNQDVVPASSIYSPRGQGGFKDAKCLDNY